MSPHTVYGAPTPDRSIRFVSGMVQSVSPNKCTVLTQDGRVLLVDWPSAQSSPSGAGFVVRPPEQGQTVLVQLGSGRPFIAQTLPNVSPRSDSNRAFSVSDTGRASNAFGSMGAMYQDLAPTDTLPGDQVWVGNQGQKLGILEGGVAFISATPFACARALQKDDTFQLFGRNLHLETGFGTLKFWDQAGKRGLDFQGGFDQATESGTGRDNWTVRFALGPHAQGMFDLGLYTRDGDTVYTHNIDTEGNRTENIGGGHTRVVNGRVVENIGFGRSVSIRQQHDDLYVAGAWRRVVGGEALLSSTGKMELYCSSDRFDSIRRDHTMSVGRNAEINVSGDMVTGTPASKALTMKVSNGGFFVDVGNPINLDLQKTKSGFTVQTWLGDITLQSMLTGRVILNTTIPESVLLGANAGVAPFSAVIFEQLQSFLTTFITSLITVFDTHIHLPPTSPPVPSATVLAPLVAQMISFKSLKVKLGG